MDVMLATATFVLLAVIVTAFHLLVLIALANSAAHSESWWRRNFSFSICLLVFAVILLHTAEAAFFSAYYIAVFEELAFREAFLLSLSPPAASPDVVVNGALRIILPLHSLVTLLMLLNSIVFLALMERFRPVAPRR